MIENDPFGVFDAPPSQAAPAVDAALVKTEALDALIPIATLAAAVEAMVAPGRGELAALALAWRSAAGGAKGIETDDDALRAEEALKVAARVLASTETVLADGKEWFHSRHKIFTAASASVAAVKAELDGLLRPLLGAFIQRKRQAEAERERINREAAELDRKQRAAQAAEAAVKSGASNVEAIQVAQEVLQRPLALAPVQTTAGPKTGITGAWRARLVSKADLVVYVGEQVKKGDLSNLSLLDYVEAQGNALAKVQQANLQVPGLVAEQKTGVLIRKGAK